MNLLVVLASITLSSIIVCLVIEQDLLVYKTHRHQVEQIKEYYVEEGAFCYLRALYAQENWTLPYSNQCIYHQKQVVFSVSADGIVHFKLSGMNSVSIRQLSGN